MLYSKLDPYLIYNFLSCRHFVYTSSVFSEWQLRSAAQQYTALQLRIVLGRRKGGKDRRSMGDEGGSEGNGE